MRKAAESQMRSDENSRASSLDLTVCQRREMEARYEAPHLLVLSQELKNLEEQERRSAARYQREKEDLDYLQKISLKA